MKLESKDMESGTIIISIIAAILGVATGFINSRISKKLIRSNNMNAALGVSVIRVLVAVCCLAIVFAICKIFGSSYLIPLLVAALGVTISGILFLLKLTKEMEKDKRD